MTEREERIRQRAYELWELAGKPEEQERFWIEAEEQINAEERDPRPDPPPQRGGWGIPP